MKENNILVIGNGFDLALKYDTKYSHFIAFVKAVCVTKLGKCFNNEQAEMLDVFNSNIEKMTSIGSYTVLKQIASNNCFIQYLISINEELISWVDIEEEIKRIIEAISKVFCDDYAKNEYVAINSKGMAYIKKEDCALIRVLKEFKLIDLKKGNIIANGSTIIQDNRKYVLSDKYFDSFYKVKWKELDDYLVSQLNEFKQALIIYLRDYVPLIKEIKNQSVSSSTKKQLATIKPSLIISFNYTDFVKDIYPDDIKYVSHVHGDFKIYNRIVLGYEDNNPNNTRFIRFKKYFQCLEYIIPPIDLDLDIYNYNHRFINLLMFFDRLRFNLPKMNRYYQNNKIHFYGLSFDTTDGDYIQKIYNLSNSIKIVYYYDEDDYVKKSINLIKIFGKDKIIKDLSNGQLFFKEIVK